MCNTYSRYRPNSILSCTPTVALDVVEPVTLDDVKVWLRITFDDDNTLLTILISECRDGLEQFCKLSLVEKEYELIADLYADQVLPFGPVNTITSVMWLNGTTYEASTSYNFDAGRFCPQVSGRWKIVYTAGPVDMVSNASLRADLKRIIAYCYEHRGDEALTSLQSGQARPGSLDEAMELFAGKYVNMSWL